MFMEFILKDEKVRKIDTQHFGDIRMLDDVEQLFTIAGILTSVDASLFSFIGW